MWVKPQLTSLRSLKNLVLVLILLLFDRATCTPSESFSFLICNVGLKQFLSQGIIQRVKKIAANCTFVKEGNTETEVLRLPCVCVERRKQERHVQRSGKET